MRHLAAQRSDAALRCPHALSVAAVVAGLDTDLDRGLDDDQVRERALRHGPNVLPAQGGPSRLRRLAGQLHNPLIYVLLAAGAVTAMFGGYVDASVIAGVIVLNALIGYVQESRAARALTALSDMVPAETAVVRSGMAALVPAAGLVPGDVVLLAAGDRVPADVRVAEAHGLEVDESALTGESAPVGKSTGVVAAQTVLADRHDMAHAGTMAAAGTGRGVVVATAGATELGAIGRLVAATTTVTTPLTRKLDRFAGQLSLVIVAVAVVTFLVGVLRGMPIVESFTAVVALAVGAIPEGLPAAVSIVLAIGVVRMARRKTVLRHLPAVETLGSTTVICTDKTGTLTQNRMTVGPVAAGGRLLDIDAAGTDRAARECLLAGVLCSDVTLQQVDGQLHAAGDPTETALIFAAETAGIDPARVRVSWPRTDVLPFDSARRMMLTVHRVAGSAGEVGYAKGAVEEVLDRCRDAMSADGSPGPLHRAEVLRLLRDLAGRGLRVLAFAKFVPVGGELAGQLDRGGWTFLGLQGMWDPPRPAAIAAVRACRQAGIAVKMITGDHADTARAIAAAVGVGAAGGDGDVTDVTIRTGAELDRLGDQELTDIAARTTVFARVSPGHKLRLVTALQRRGNIVAMTGDGVNDAPALRRADIGVAMGIGGTDAARQAADMVLTDDDFASVEAAVEEGRGVFDNLRKFIAWTVPTNIGEGVVVLVAVLLGATLPIVPVQILWINMTTAVFLGLALAFEPKEPNVMERPPRPPRTPLLTGSLLRKVALVSALLVLAAFAGFRYEIAVGASVAEARTAAVNVFVCVQIAYLFSCRVLDRTVLRRRNVPRNRMVLVGVGVTAVLQLLLTYLPTMNALFHTAPIGVTTWLWILGAALLALLVAELDKAVWAATHREGPPVVRP